MEHTVSLTDTKGFSRFFAPLPLQSVQDHHGKDLKLIRLIRIIQYKGVHSSQVMLRIKQAMPGLCTARLMYNTEHKHKQMEIA